MSYRDGYAGGYAGLAGGVYLFTPPSVGEIPRVELTTRRYEEQLYRHVGRAGRGKNVFYLSDGTVTETQPASWDDVTRFFQGGATHEVTATEAAVLAAAGYTVENYSS